MTLLQTVTFFSFVLMCSPQPYAHAVTTDLPTQTVAQQEQEHADALLAACAIGDVQGVAQLLLDGVNPHCVDSNRDSAFMLAALGGHTAVAEWLLMTGADAQHVNKAKFTAADLAIQNGHVDFVQLLIDHELIALNKRNTYGCTPLMIATQYGHDAIIAILIKAGAAVDEEAVILAIAKGHCQTVRLLHRHGAPLSIARRCVQAKDHAMHETLRELCK